MDQENNKKLVVNHFLMCDVIFSEETENLETATMSPAVALKNASSIFASLYKGSKLSLFKFNKRKDGEEPEPYPNDIMATHEGICLLRINNIKHAKLVEEADTTTNGITDYETNTYVSNPYCFVIIDNREDKGILQMAIQKNSAWGDTKTLRDVLEQYWNSILLCNGIPLRIKISPKMRPSEIWEFCRERCGVGNDSIRRIAFDFPNQRKISKLNRIPNPKGYIKQLAQLSELTHAIKTHIHMDYDGADPQLIEDNMSDLANIVKICANEEYDLSILFRNYGLYKCNDVVKAIFAMPETILNAFMTEWTDDSYEPQQRELITWCDESYEQAKLFDYANQVPDQRHR